MKKIVIALIVACSLPAFAGKMKAIYTMTEESVKEELAPIYWGEDINYLQLEQVRFIQIEGVDLAVESMVRIPPDATYTTPYVHCVTRFKSDGKGFFDVIGTKCQEVYH